MRFQEAAQFIIDKLETGLPSYITYHTADHTKNVIGAAEELAIAENINEEELILLKTAALFHDTGFLQHHHEHEELSCKLARKHLPEFGYSGDQIEQICRMIMATRLPQHPADRLAEILCDADLYYLGTDKYGEYSDKLYHELKKTKMVGNDSQWLLRQIEFLTSHRYFTKTAQDKLNVQKQAVLTELQGKLQHNVVHKESPLQLAQDILMALVGITIAGIALKLFLVPNHFFDGGVTGISLLIHELYHFNLGLAILLFNLPLIILGYYIVGRRFAIRTVLCVILLGICLMLIPDYAVTADKLLISIFGGAFLGIGIGLIMRIGAALDGIEVLALYAMKKTSFTITEIILAINILIFSIAAFNPTSSYPAPSVPRSRTVVNPANKVLRACTVALASRSAPDSFNTWSFQGTSL